MFLQLDVLSLVLAGILGYLIGSIPTAFLIVRWTSNIDIRTEGSGNVGALNSLEVTKSKFAGGAVLLLDLLKGVVAVVVSSVLLDDQFAVQATGGVAAVVGHNFPVWLKFKGGRGLATGAGVLLVIGWVFVAAWLLLWGLGFILTRHINASNALASVLTILAVCVAPAAVLSPFVGQTIPLSELRFFCVVLFIVILLRHIDPVHEYLRNLRVSR